MSPIDPEHGEVLSLLNDWSHDVTDRNEVRIRVQSSIGIPDLGSAPEPDIVWAVRKSYAKCRPIPADVLLLIEVADSSLQYDLGAKADLYAEAGLTDYWVVDIPNFRVHMHREPAPEGYRSIEVFANDDVVQPLNVPNATLDVAELFNCLK